jgi:5-methylthioadenosine/S-adenosylhomocysteine deaminase
MLTLIENVCAVVNDDKGTVLDRTDILIDDDRIAAVGTDLRSALNTRPVDSRVIDAQHAIAIPGIVNAHLHSNESFEQGMSEKLPLELWRLRTYPPFGVPPLTEEDYYLRAMMSGIASIHSGVTTVQDDVLNMACTPASVDGACRAYRDLGLRAWVTTSMGDRSFAASHAFLDGKQSSNFGNAVGGAHPVSAKGQIELFERNHGLWNGAEHGRIRINIGPRGPQRCSDDLLTRIIDASERYGCAVHTHVLETRAQAVTAQRDYGRSMIAHLADMGFLGPRLTINHGIWLTDDDIALLGQHGCTVTHNPLSNLKLGSGICRVRDLLQAGINIALGTDGLATSDTADMIAVLRCATMLHTATNPDFDQWVSAQEGFHMATRGGAASGLMGDELGMLAVGRKADIVLLDRRHWSFVPLHNPITQLAYSASPEAVRTVMIDGQIVMEDGVIGAIEEDLVRDAIIEAAERWRCDIKPLALAAAETMTPVMAAAYRDAIRAFESEEWAEPLRRSSSNLR